jgi:hypothetical protein
LLAAEVLTLNPSLREKTKQETKLKVGVMEKAKARIQSLEVAKANSPFHPLQNSDARPKGRAFFLFLAAIETIHKTQKSAPQAEGRLVSF